MKKLQQLKQNAQEHWVGDGFPVRSIFSYNDDPGVISPFLLMDYAAPRQFGPTEQVRGVGDHPHRGFETVTIVYSGEVDHRDSHGGGGSIGPGDVQWMTAGAGLVHQEYHGERFRKEGGAFEMIQLWVNLPKKHKMTKPRYQEIKSAEIPRVDLADGAGYLRVIAGEYQGHKGPAQTFSPVNLWDLRLNAGKSVKLLLTSGHTAGIFVLSGNVTTTDGKTIPAAACGFFEKDGAELALTANEDTKILVLGGEPIKESVVGYGPFVMNTIQEIHQAIDDYQNGRMGQIV